MYKTSLAVVALLAAGCGTSTSKQGGGAPSTIALVPASATMLVGDNVAFSASITAAGGATVSGVSATWSTSDGTVVKVDAAGNATALAPGEADLSAALAGVSGHAHVKVVARTVALSVALGGAGAGRVTSAPAGLDCGTACAFAFAPGSSVLLTATPAADGSTFAGFGGACKGTDACRLTLSADTSVTAAFDPPMATLTVAVTGAGGVSGPAGFTCAAGTCTARFVKGAAVALEAAPAGGSVFKAWGGACGGAGACSVVLAGDASVSADFAATHVVTTVVTGGGTITSTPAGINCKASGGACSASFLAGTPVTLTEAAGSGSFFTGWSGGASCGTAATCAVVASADVSAGAAFAAGAQLTVSVTGNGSVTSSPAGIACSATSAGCSAFFPLGTPVMLTAASSPGSALSRWVGGLCGSGNGCPLTLSTDAAVSAVFAAQVPLSVSVSGGGKVVSAPAGISCTSGTCQAYFDQAATVVLSATANNGSVFTAWSGDCAGASSCSVAMSAPRATTAAFVAQHTVTVQVAGTGNVTSASAPINCAGASGTCSAIFKDGDPLSLTAAPGPGFFFGGWTGGGCGAQSTCSLGVTADLIISAAFNAGAALNVSVVGSGSVGSAPAAIACPGTCGSSFALGTSVKLTATPSTGYAFTGWSGGGCSGILPCTLALNAATAVTATFTAQPVLTVVVTGAGTVTSSPTGISCTAGGGSCSAPFAAGTAITLSESPGTNLQFGGWGGACAGTLSNCPITISADTSATAIFGSFYQLSFTTTGPGLVSADSGAVKNCGPSSGTCTGLYPVGSQVTLTETPGTGAALSAWGGACASAVGNQCVVSMSQVQSGNASFSNVTTLAVAGGDQQSAYLAGPLTLPVVIHVTNTVGGANTPGTPVTLVGPPGSSVTPSPAISNGQGLATFYVRLSRNLGLHTFTAAAPTAPSSVNATATATLPPAGSIFTVVNASHNAGFDGFPGPATAAHLKKPTGLALSGNGTLYISDAGNHAIFMLDTSGVLKLIAGNGSCGSTGDGGPASAALLCSPYDLALDETNGNKMLYVADYQNSKVRAIDLTQAPPSIATFAGGGNPIGPGYGDNYPADQASLAYPSRISLGPDGYLYIGDQNRNRIRRVNLTTKIISNWLAGDAYFCGFNACSVAWDANKTPYISRNLGYYQFGAYRVNADFSTTLVAGGSNTNTADNIYATQAQLFDPPTILFDAAGNMLLTDQGYINPGGHNVRRVDPATSRIVTIAGNGMPAYLGDYTAANQAELNSPWTSVLDPSGDLIIADTANSAVRIFWSAGQAAPAVSTLSIAGGNGQSVAADQITAPMQVKLVDPLGQPLAAYPVTWTSIDPGGALFLSTSNTNASGIATVQGRVGRTADTSWHYSASAADFYGNAVTASPVTFTQTSTPLPAGYLYSSVNTSHSLGFDGFPGAATTAHIGQPRGLVYDSSNTLYLSDATHHAVFALSPAGLLKLIAGNGTQGYSGDGLAATAAQLNSPTDLAMDETNGRKTLYIADASNNVIRAVDLKATPPTISTLAGCVGAGCTTAAPYGDGQLATTATLSYPAHITMGPGDGYLYVSDNNRNTIRRVDLSVGNAQSGTINTWITGPDYYFCLGNACKVAFSSKGTPYIFRNLGYYYLGIYRVDGASPFSSTLIAGGSGGSQTNTADGVKAIGAYFYPGSLAFDGNDTLYLTDPLTHRVRYLSDLTTNATINTAIGTGAAANGADGAVPGNVALNNPWAAIISPDGRLVVADTGNFVVREIWK